MQINIQSNSNMDNLIINPSTHTPRIHFDASSGILEISGTSTPEDSFNFFQPIMSWLELYKSQPAAKTTLIFKMEYFNTSSTAFILRIIKVVGQINEAEKNVSVQWHYQEEDEDLVEAGRDFGILAEIPIELIQVP